MKTRPLYLLIIFIILILFLIASASIYCRFFFSSERKAYIMGTAVRVKVKGWDAFYLTEDVLQEIKTIDGVFSKFNPSSEVSLINKLAGLAPLQVSKETFEVLRLASRISRLTHGAFDVTLGYPKHLILDKKLRKVYLRKKGIKIDLGGIGKGFAVESARKLLLKKGAKSGIIDMRSSIAVFGPDIWKVGIKHPRKKDKLIGTVELRNGQSLATSGDYERGKHILDPRTGKPAEGCQRYLF
jgi:thiamine biosynthesis lipoprotein